MPKLSEERITDRVRAENKQLKATLVERKTYFESIIETQNAHITELATLKK